MNDKLHAIADRLQAFLDASNSQRDEILAALQDAGHEDRAEIERVCAAGGVTSLAALVERLGAALVEIEQLAQLLRSARCIYCGIVFESSEDQKIADAVLREHVADCSEHPLGKARAEMLDACHGAALMTEICVKGLGDRAEIERLRHSYALLEEERQRQHDRAEAAEAAHSKELAAHCHTTAKEALWLGAERKVSEQKAEIERLRAADKLGIGALAALATKNKELAEREHNRAEAAEAKLAASASQAKHVESYERGRAAQRSCEEALAAERAKTAGAEERSKIVLKAKNYWADRAIAVKARTAKLVEALELISGTTSGPGLSAPRIATAALADWVSSAPQSIEGSTDAASGMGAADTGVMPRAPAKAREEKP